MTSPTAKARSNEQRKGIRRSALAVALLAASIYIGFILLVHIS